MDETKNLPLVALQISPINPRKHFPQTSINELAQSIKQVGIIEPLVVRPVVDPEVNALGTFFEIVCGERRFRAAIIAEISEVPCQIRTLTDDQVLDIQITENLQREDMSPLDECNIFQSLMDKRHLALQDVAIKFGKSVDYIFGRLRLSNLIEAGRQALENEIIPITAAIKIAHLSEKQQKMAINRTIVQADVDGKMTQFFTGLRDLKMFFDNNVLMSLVQANFDTKSETLFPEAGPCTTCIKKTGNNMFSEMSGTNKCLDNPCYKMKHILHYQALKKQTEEKNKKVEVVFAARTFNMEKEFAKELEVIPINDYTEINPSKAKSSKSAVLAVLVGPDRDPEEKKYDEVIWIEVIKSKKKAVNNSESSSQNGEDQTLAAEKVFFQNAVNAKFQYLAFDNYSESNKGKAIDHIFFLWILANLIHHTEDDFLEKIALKHDIDFIVGLLGTGSTGYTSDPIQLFEAIQNHKWKAGEAERLFNDLAFIRDISDAETFPILAKALGMDLKKITKAAEAEVKKERKAELVAK